MTKKGRANGSFFGNHIYENLLARRSHLLYELSQVVDFSFVRHICRDFYVDWGRDAWDPVLMFKMVFLQFLYDLSDRMENPLNVTVSNYWSRHGDLNPRPADYESAALPLSYAGLAFSLAASCLLRNAHRWSDLFIFGQFLIAVCDQNATNFLIARLPGICLKSRSIIIG